MLDSGGYQEENPYPSKKQPYQAIVTATRDGAVTMKDSLGNHNQISGSKKLTKEEEEQLRLKIAEQTRRINEQIAAQQQQLQKHMADVQRQIQNSFNVGFGSW